MFDSRTYVRNLILQWHCVEGSPCILTPHILKVVHRGSSWAVGVWDLPASAIEYVDRKLNNETKGYVRYG